MISITSVGLRGRKGDSGNHGNSAYEIAVSEGYSGNITSWLSSLRGDKGDKGDQGDSTIVNAQGDPFYAHPSKTAAENTVALQSFINYVVNNHTVGYIPPGKYNVTRLYGKYHATGNPQGNATPRNFKIYGAGRLGDRARISDANPEKTVINFTDTTGDLFDFSTEGSPWNMRNIEITDINFTGSTWGYILNTSGAFKSTFHRIGIYNKNFIGNGWKLNNFDQVNVQDVFVLGPLNVQSTGIAFDLRSDATAIDGSLSVFDKLLGDGFSVCYQFGQNRDDGIDGNYQSFNTFNSIGALNCGTAMFLGDRWHNNIFNNPQLRGEQYGIILAGRNDHNTFISGIAQCNDTANAVTALYIGYGSTAANKETQNNVFKNFVFQTNRQAAPPVIWNSDGSSSLVKNNVLEDCQFESIATGFATNGIFFTSTGNSHIPTGSIIRPVFKRINVPYSYQNNAINVINPETTRTLDRNFTTTTNTPTSIGSFRVYDNKAISIRAHVIAIDTGTPTTNNHASFMIHALAYNSNGTMILADQHLVSNIKTNANISCVVDVSGKEIRLIATGLTGISLKWQAKVEAIVTI